MPSRPLAALVIAAIIVPAPAIAADPGFFAGIDASAGTASGSSHTTDGGAPFAGGGIVRNVDFGTTIGFGGHVGYRFNAAVSAFVSYRHVRGDIGWDADFPSIGAASSFHGKAVSDAIAANVAYDLPVAAATVVRASAGAGLAFNVLSHVVETDRPTGLFLSDVAHRTRTEPVVRLGLGVEHRLAPRLAAGLAASASYDGGFETGDTRSGNLGITAINPYRIGHVWRTGLAASIRFRF
jgi:hypothetical protein